MCLMLLVRVVWPALGEDTLEQEGKRLQSCSPGAVQRAPRGQVTWSRAGAAPFPHRCPTAAVSSGVPDRKACTLGQPLWCAFRLSFCVRIWEGLLSCPLPAGAVMAHGRLGAEVSPSLCTNASNGGNRHPPRRPPAAWLVPTFPALALDAVVPPLGVCWSEGTRGLQRGLSQGQQHSSEESPTREELAPPLQ